MEDNLLIKYFEGSTTEKQVQEVTEWLQANEANMRHYQQICRLYELIYWQDKPEISNNNKTKRFGFLTELFKVAVVFCLALGLGYLLFSQREEPETMMQTVYVPVGQNAQLTLTDGTKVYLNADSKLRFPNRFSSGERKVYLDGEGYFEVQTNKEKPFVVRTKSYSVKALGTTFDVNAYNGEEEFETALLKGSVVITNHTTNQLLKLTPNMRAVVHDNKLTTVPIKNMDYYLWRQGIVYFDEPVVNVLKKLEQYFDVKIDIKNKAILRHERHCIGKFRMRDGLDHFLKVLQQIDHFEYVKDEENNIVIIK